MARGDAVIYRAYVTNNYQWHQPASGVEICITSVLLTGGNNRAFLIQPTSTGELFPLAFGNEWEGARTGHSTNMKLFTNNTDYYGMRTSYTGTIYYIISGIQTK